MFEPPFALDLWQELAVAVLVAAAVALAAVVRLCARLLAKLLDDRDDLASLSGVLLYVLVVAVAVVLFALGRPVVAVAGGSFAVVGLLALLLVGIRTFVVEPRRAAARRRDRQRQRQEEQERARAAAEQEERRRAAEEEERRRALAAEQEERRRAAEEEERRRARAAEEERLRMATAAERQRRELARRLEAEEEEERRHEEAVAAGRRELARRRAEAEEARRAEEEERRRKAEAAAERAEVAQAQREERWRRYEERRELILRQREEARSWSRQERSRLELLLLESLDRITGGVIGSVVDHRRVAQDMGVADGHARFLAEALASKAEITMEGLLVPATKAEYEAERTRARSDDVQRLTEWLDRRPSGGTRSRGPRRPSPDEPPVDVPVDAGLRIALTEKGIRTMKDDVVSKLRELTPSGDVFMVNSTLISGDGNRNVSHSPHSVVNQSGDVDTADIEKLREVLDLYREALGTGAMAAPEADLARRRLDLVGAELAHRPMDRPLIRQTLQSLRALAEGVAGNAIFAQLAASLNLF